MFWRTVREVLALRCRRRRGGALMWSSQCLFLSVSLVLAAAPRAPAACTPAPSGLLSWWPGDGNAADIVYTNTGTLQGGATNITGLVGKAFTFDGSSAFVQIADSPSLRPTNLTIECWV